MRSLFHLSTLVWILPLIGVSLNHSQAWAQSLNSPSEGTSIIYNAPPPPDQGTPDGRQRGGASRGTCQSYEALTALVPTVENAVWGLTASDRPTFWFYLPNSMTPETAIEFVVQDEADNYIYQTRFTAPETQSGLISLSLPASSPALEVGKSYSWTLSVYCDRDRPSRTVFVAGTIQRTALDAELQNQLAIATPLERANLLAARGVWYDALATLAELYQAEQNNSQTTTAWLNLLKQANLEPLATAPFTPCCTPEQ
jgi:hypothetical protein